MTSRTRTVQPGSVVVGVDGSTHAERALRWAAEEASLGQSPLVVLAATGVPAVGAVDLSRVVAPPRPDPGPDPRAAAQTIADGAAAIARATYPQLAVTALVAPGDPREALLDASEDARLLVVGSHGRGAARALLLGSVSLAVSKHASCPLVVCRPRAGTLARHGVVVGSDGTAESAPALDFAFRHASLHHLPLTVIHCLWDALAAAACLRELPAPYLDPATVREMRAILEDNVSGLVERYPDVRVILEVRHGLVDEVLANEAAQWDLVVVGRHHRHAVARLMTGSITTTVVEHAHGTVAVVPDADPVRESSGQADPPVEQVSARD